MTAVDIDIIAAEADLATELGMGNHYNWFNGSGSCQGIRTRAAQQLPQVLRAHGITPNQRLCDLVTFVAGRGEDSQFVLTRTWTCLRDVLRAHLAQHHVGSGMGSGDVAEIERLHQPRAATIGKDGIIYGY